MANICRRKRSMNDAVKMNAAAEQLRAVIDTAVDGVILFNAAGTTLMFNAACVRLFGYTAKELAGRAIKTLVPGILTGDLDRTAYPTRGHRKDGSTFPVELSLGQASRPGESVFVSVIRDISERQELEAAFLDAIGREQRRLGSDLHDSLGQDLTGLSLLVSALTRSARDGERLEVGDLEQAEEVVRRALQSCRNIAHGLSSVTESQGGLISGLRDLVARLKTASGPSLDFEAIETAPLGLSPAACDHLFRIAQEALANALRHAHANSITVKLDVEPGSVRLKICDDGDGLPFTELSASGIGLRTMRYRASLLGAKFQITRLDHAGTCIACECPQAA
jgi:PAS domain S-box-containing protein